MLELFTGTCISLIIQKLLMLYFNNVSLYFDFFYFSCKNLFYISIFEIGLGWCLYEHTYTDSFIIFSAFELKLSYELFIDDFIIIYKNIKSYNKLDYWQLIKKIYRTHGKRFMLFKDYRKSLLSNLFKLTAINFFMLLTFLVLVEILLIISLFYCLKLLTIISIKHGIYSKYNEYSNYLKGLSYRSFLTKLYYKKNYFFYFLYCIIFFLYLNLHNYLDARIFIGFVHSTLTFFLYYYLKFLIIYNFYFSFFCVFTLNNFIKNVRLTIKLFFIKFYIYIFLLFGFNYLICTKLFSEITFNNNFFQEFLLTFLLSTFLWW